MGGAGADCFVLPDFEAISVDAANQDDTKNAVAARVAEVSATRDRITDFKSEDTIVAGGAAEVRGNNIVVVVVAAADAVPDISPRVKEVAPILATVSGDTPTRESTCQ